MKRLTIVKRAGAGLLAIVLLAAAGPRGSARAPLVSLEQPVTRFQIQAPNPAALKQLVPWLASNQFDLAGVNAKRGQVDVFTTDAGLEFLRGHGVNGRVIERRAAGALRAFDQASRIDPRYLNPDRLTAKLQAIAKAHPDLARLEPIGKSLEGRPIWGLLISTTPNPNDPAYFEKPSILFDGMHHAREIMTVEIVSDVADSLLSAVQARNPRALDVLKNWNVWLVPMLNVDGNNIVWTQDNWWRKNARGDGGRTWGVDINRNYPYRWAACNGSSGNQGAQDFHGQAGASEPETQALMNLAARVRPAASLSYHSYGEYVLYPYGCKGEQGAESAMIDRIGKELAAHLPADSGGGTYSPGPPWQLLYPVDGDSMDSMYTLYGALAYTFEVNEDFQPNYDVREPTLRKHRAAWQWFLDRIDASLLGVKVIDARANRPVAARIAINKVIRGQNHAPFETNAGGNFFKVLEPGDYVISAKLPDGRVGELPVRKGEGKQLVTLTVN